MRLWRFRMWTWIAGHRVATVAAVAALLLLSLGVVHLWQRFDDPVRRLRGFIALPVSYSEVEAAGLTQRRD